MGRWDELRGALAIASAAMGADFVSGRALTLFYAQTARASWLGVAISGLMFGLITGAISSLRRRCGADNLTELLRRIPGGGAGRGITIAYDLILAGAAALLISQAGGMGALTLPIRHAFACGAALALLTAAVIAVSGGAAMRTVGGAFVLMLALFEGALAVFGRLPNAPRMRYELELGLRDNWIAAILFALLHTAVCLCLSAGVTVKMSRGSMRPAWLGAYAGGAFAILLALGNAVLILREDELLALKIPFAALAAGWGTAGFYLSAGMIFLAAVISLAGILYGRISRPAGADLLGK